MVNIRVDWKVFTNAILKEWGNGRYGKRENRGQSAEVWCTHGEFEVLLASEKGLWAQKGSSFPIFINEETM